MNICFCVSGVRPCRNREYFHKSQIFSQHVLRFANEFNLKHLQRCFVFIFFSAWVFIICILRILKIFHEFWFFFSLSTYCFSEVVKLRTNCVYFLGQNDLLNDRSEDCGRKKRIKYVKIIEIPIPSWFFFLAKFRYSHQMATLFFSFSPQTTSIIYNDGFCERHSCHAFLLLVRAVDSSFFSLSSTLFFNIFRTKWVYRHPYCVRCQQYTKQHSTTETFSILVRNYNFSACFRHVNGAARSCSDIYISWFANIQFRNSILVSLIFSSPL